MDAAISLLALALLGGLVSYVALLIVGQVRAGALAVRHAELERAALQARIQQIQDQRRFERATHELSWNGFRKFQIVRKIPESRDICSFYLAPHDGKALPPFLPGQYLTFQLTISSKPVVRCYSLSDSPNHPDYYRVTIKRVPAPREPQGLPPGLVSNYFHDRLKVGDIVDVKAPAGHFTLDLAIQTPVVLIAGGVGITPLLCMLNAAIEANARREIWFLYGVRNRAEHIMKEHLQQIAREHPNVRLHVCYSDPGSDDRQGEDYHHGERVSVDLLKRLLPSSNYTFFICGPPPMMDQLLKDLKAWGVPEGQITIEAFGPKTVKRVAPNIEGGPATRPSGPAIEVTFAKSGKTCQWDGDTGSLLECAEKHGVAINFGCRAGNCGTCLTAVKQGEVDYLVEQGAKPEAGSCLACIAVPKTSVVLDA
jgi:ferredoxin-NADP reductase